MSTVTAQGPRTIQSTVQRILPQDGGVGTSAPTASASGRLAARLPVVDPVASDQRVSLSQQALDAPVAQLGERSVDVTQKFIDQLASALFGDARFALDAVSVTADASLSGAVAQGQGADAATLSLDQSAHFIGKGQIATADGLSFNFEIEIKYQAQAGGAPAAQQAVAAPDALTLIGKQLPAIKFPGSLADLFKVLGRQLQASANDAGDKGDSGNLSLRLLRLVNSAALLAPRARPDDPQTTPAERDKALASYAPSAPSIDLGSA
jgi:hypothetical protein